jgi:hypothetical protein
MLRNEMKKKLKALKSTQITIKLVRIKIELNTNERTQLSFERSGANPKVLRENERRGEIKSIVPKLLRISLHVSLYQLCCH